MSIRPVALFLVLMTSAAFFMPIAHAERMQRPEHRSVTKMHRRVDHLTGHIQQARRRLERAEAHHRAQRADKIVNRIAHMRTRRAAIQERMARRTTH